MSKLDELDKEFDEKVPLEYFASTDFPYNFKETPMEWQLLKWQDQETKKAEGKREYFKSFLHRYYSLGKLEEREAMKKDKKKKCKKGDCVVYRVCINCHQSFD